METTPEMKDAIPCDATEMAKVQDLQNKIPIYPEPLLEDNPEYDLPKYTGDIFDLTERRNVKLYNLWSVWSDLRKNEKLIHLLEVNKKDKDDIKFLKAMMTLTIDRMGKVLADTNLIEELCLKKERRDENEPPTAIDETEPSDMIPSYA